MDGELLVPVKEAMNLLGAEMSWDQATKTLTLKRNQHTLSVTVGNLEATADGQHMQLKAAPYLDEGLSLIPISEVAAYLGWTVEQHKEGQTTAIDLTCP
jgi:hypothetical protein